MRGLVVILAVALLAPRAARACDEAEYRRLSEELANLAQRNVWSGVERTAERLEATDCPLTAEQHRLGAEAARVLGHTLEELERLRLARELDDDPRTADRLEAIVGSFGRVIIKGDPRRPPALERDVMPFAPDEQRSIEWARTLLTETGTFDGMLPRGEYRVGGEPLVVEPGGDEPVRVVVSRRRADAVADAADVPEPSDKGRIRYAGLVAHLGPSWFGTPETARVVRLADGGHQLSPGSVSVLGVTASGGVELGLTWAEPALGVAAGLAYTGGYGLDTLHGVSAWSLLVIRPGRARLAIGPEYRIVAGRGTGVAAWVDRGQEPTSQPREGIRYGGAAWGPGLQAWAGYCPVELEPFQGLIELGGTVGTDGARPYLTVGLRVGVVPRVPRFNG